jgi:hypothetical protein
MGNSARRRSPNPRPAPRWNAIHATPRPCTPRARSRPGGRCGRGRPGELEGAHEALLQVLAVDPLADDVIDTLVRLQPMQLLSPDAAAVRAALNRMVTELDHLPERGQAEVLFALAWTLEAEGDPDGSFDALLKANHLQRQAMAFDIGAAERRFAAVAEAFSA